MTEDYTTTETTTNDPVGVVDALDQGFSHRMIAVEFGIDITHVEAIADALAAWRNPPAPAPRVPLPVLQARARHLMEG